MVLVAALVLAAAGEAGPPGAVAASGGPVSDGETGAARPMEGATGRDDPGVAASEQPTPVSAGGERGAASPGALPLPWGRGQATVGAGVEASISSSLTVLAPGVRAGYFVTAGLELGAQVDVALLLWSAADFTAHPGLRREAPGLAVRVTPTLRYVFLRQAGFSPYLLAGVGPTIWNHGGGVAGHWIAAPGGLIHLGGRVYLDLAIRFSSIFPGGACRRVFAVGGTEVPGYCGFQFGPRLGLAMAF